MELGAGREGEGPIPTLGELIDPREGPGIDGIWPTGGAWLCYHLWEHYLFTGDKQFLAHAYPVMKGASQFFMDSLVKDPKTGWLVTSPG